MVALEPDILVLKPPQALQQKDRAGYQHQRQRRLHDDQYFLRQSGSMGRRTARAPQRLSRVRMRRNPSRRNPKNDACDHRQREGKHQCRS